MRELVALLAAGILTASLTAQAQPAVHLVGTEIGGRLQWHADTQTTTETSRLVFRGVDGREAFTIEFVAQYPGYDRPGSAPEVVDMIVTQHPADEARPNMTLRVNSETVPLVPRARSAPSIVASMPFAEFVRLANADAIEQRAFDTDLEFGAGQLRMLRLTAARWSGR